MSKQITKNVKDLFSRIHFTGITVPILGVEFNFEYSSVEIRKYLKDLYTLRNSLVYYYYSYYSLKERLSSDYFDDNELEEETTLRYFRETLESYRDIQKIIIGSDYFLLLKNHDRKKLLESFDYIFLLDTLMEHDEDYEVSVDEQQKIIMDLLNLFEHIDETINKFSSMLYDDKINWKYEYF